MNAATAHSPGRPGLNPADLFEPDRRDWLRLLGGILLALGATVLYVRKFEAWGEFLKFLVVLIPFVVLYGLGWLGGLRDRGDGARRPEGWQIVFLILGSVLAGFVVAQVFLMLGAEELGPLHQAAVTAAVAAAAYAASFLRNIPFLSILGGLAALWAWGSLWEKILGGVDSIDTGRALLLIFAAIMLAAAIALRMAERAQAADFVTVAGIAALIAGLLSVTTLIPQFDTIGDDSKPTEVWNFFLLVISLALIAYGAKAPSRGPGYVGAVGLLAFVGITGANAVAIANGNFDDREKLAGWPLLLLLLGIATLVASFFLPREGAGGRTPATGPDGVPGAPRPGAGYDQPGGQYGAPGQPAGGHPPQAPPPPAPPQPAPPPQPTQQRPVPPPPPPPQQWAPPQPHPPQGAPPPGDQTAARPVPPPPPDNPGQPPHQ